MGRGYKLGRTKARKFAIKMREIDEFCAKNGIIQSRTSDSYYFTIHGERYRVSNHTQKQSDKGMFNSAGVKVRESYHMKDGKYEYDREHEITAGKTRIIEVYTALRAGKRINKRGYVID